ncbi:Uncharacterised protein [Mycobacteroides abscessus subsp. massiliense]|nr:Uncharacterised protein [Mycobacteroides abscessus subsp. massiliense]
MVPHTGQPTLLGLPDSVQHLVLVIAGTSARLTCHQARRLDDRGIVRGHHGIPVTLHQYAQTAQIGDIDVLGVSMRNSRRLVIGALAQPNT